MKKFLLLSLLFILSPIATRAATCDPGYYDNNGTCTRCTNGYYCPGDGTMIVCPSNTPTPQEISNLTGADLQSCEQSMYISSMARTNYPSDISDCFVALDAGYIDGCYFWQALYQYNATTGTYIQNMGTRAFRTASPGYYLVNNYGGTNYRACGQCTNAPANAHYSGPGTPDVGDCPWVCDDGYYGKSENGDTACTLCPAGYACANGVMTNCANVTGANGRPTYANAGASACTECPAVESSLSDRLLRYGYSSLSHVSVGSCTAYFTDTDDSATFQTVCWYGTNGYGSTSNMCQVHKTLVSACAAGKYLTIESVPEWNGRTYAVCNGVDCMNGKVCTDVGVGYYSPDGDTVRYACDTPPANAHSTCTGTQNSSGAWECDTGFTEYLGACHAPCPVGVGVFHAGEYSYPVFADRENVPSPVLHIRRDENTVCYVYMEQTDGNQHGLHVMYGNTPYRAIDPRI